VIHNQNFVVDHIQQVILEHVEDVFQAGDVTNAEHVVLRRKVIEMYGNQASLLEMDLRLELKRDNLFL
jgi:hypothetical protein